MINKDELKYGDTIWQVDINGTDVSLRRIEVGHLHQVAGKYWISSEQEGSMDGIMLKANSPYLFHFESDASQYLKSMYTSIDVLLNKHMEVSE
jgi:hypothetical protein